MTLNKILISGYYGFDNFGDDAILYMLVNSIKNNIHNNEITVISNNPQKIKANYNVESIYRFDLKAILFSMLQSKVFISGGGSLLQDVTSLNSLIYYLMLIFTAVILKKQVYIFAQGIGPINTFIGKALAKFILKKTTLITVRDCKSKEFLKNIGINAIQTADPVWNIEESSPNSNLINKEKINIGIQLRSWHLLDTEKINSIAQSIIDNFSSERYQINIISLQDVKDLAISQELFNTIKAQSPDINVNLISELTISSTLEVINSLDYLIAMRLHAVLVAIKYNTPTIAISYDPKVEILASECDIPVIDIKKLSQNNLNSLITAITTNKDSYINKMKTFSSKKEEEARQNIDLLIKIINNNHKK